MPQPFGGLSREKREEFAMRINKHYTGGTWYGQSASGTIYILATVLERVDPELLWCVYIPHSTFLASSHHTQAGYPRTHIPIHDVPNIARRLRHIPICILRRGLPPTPYHEHRRHQERPHLPQPRRPEHPRIRRATIYALPTLDALRRDVPLKLYRQ